MAFLIRNGCEARGIQPVRVEDRSTLTRWSYLPQATLWAAANTNILTFSAGNLGPELFNLPFGASVGTIVGFNILAVIPVAYFSTFGPKLGLRQMVMSRYSFGYWPVLVPALFNALTAIGFLSLNAILGGQTLSLSSGSDFGWSLGIVLVGLIGIFPSFLGLRALHIYSISLLPISIIIFLAILGIAAPNLSSAISSPDNIFEPLTTVGGVLGFGGTLIGFAATWSAFASDFTTYMPPDTKPLPLFFCTYFGLLTPLVLLQVLGAAVQLAAGGIPSWHQGQVENGVGGLIGAVVGTSGGGKLLLVLVALNVTANVAPTIYSAGLSLQVVVPWLLRVPRYFLAVLISFIYIPVALALSVQYTWQSALSNFLYIIGYWAALYLPPVIWENLLFRNPMSVGLNGTYNLKDWDNWKKLPIGYAAMASWVVGIPCVVAGISQHWWVGWAARRIDGGLGDIAFLIGFAAASVTFIPAR
ncbi:permease for cytosine/purines, uracil, thiamine, allantoin-domain-containing protein [Mrakia frigida]|uniref:permease for cytosine/purines, uracil, thiamine, allantoin-domain-containing protein n=1 Tax=Mrakia frigida TaxID=29902 RepID=UPI003FCBF981